MASVNGCLIKDEGDFAIENPYEKKPRRTTERYKNSIIVRSARPISPERIRLYFELPRCGGGDVVKVDSTMTHVVEFKDQEVTENVIRQTHRLNGEKLEVERYYGEELHPKCPKKGKIFCQAKEDTSLAGKIFTILRTERDNASLVTRGKDSKKRWDDALETSKLEIKKLFDSSDHTEVNNYLPELKSTMFEVLSRLMEGSEYPYSVIMDMLLEIVDSVVSFNEDKKTPLDVLLQKWRSYPDTCTTEKYRIFSLLCNSGCYLTNNSKDYLAEIESLCYIFDGTDKIDGGCMNFLESADVLSLKEATLLVTGSHQQTLSELSRLPPQNRHFKSLLVGNMSNSDLSRVLKCVRMDKFICFNIHNFDIENILTKFVSDVSTLCIVGVDIKPAPLNIKRKVAMDIINISHCRFATRQRELKTLNIECKGLRNLFIHDNDLFAIDPGEICDLTGFIAHDNEIQSLPLSLCKGKYHNFLVYNNPIKNIPLRVMTAGYRECLSYMTEMYDQLSMQDRQINDNHVKVIFVGDENIAYTEELGEVIGINGADGETLTNFNILVSTSNKSDQMRPEIDDDIILKCFDFTGDVDYLATQSVFMEDANLFLLTCDLNSLLERNPYISDSVEHHAERISDILQTIYTSSPDARVILVGTGAANMSSNDVDNAVKTFHEIITRHNRKELEVTRSLKNCSVCKPEFTMHSLKRHITTRGFPYSSCLSTNFGQFPHVVGLCLANYAANPGMQMSSRVVTNSLKDAVRKEAEEIRKCYVHIPMSWNILRKQIKHKFRASQPTATLKCQQINNNPPIISHDKFEELFRQIVNNERGNTRSSDHALKYLQSQGDILCVEKRRNEHKRSYVVDAQWLAHKVKILQQNKRSLLYNDHIQPTELASWLFCELDSKYHHVLMEILDDVGVIIPSRATSSERILHYRLPLSFSVGDLPEKVWPIQPRKKQLQSNRLFSFSALPGSFFLDLIAEVARHSHLFEMAPHYTRNHIVFVSEKTRKECTPYYATKRRTPHHIHIELIHHSKSILVTVRGKCVGEFMSEVEGYIDNVKRRRVYPGIQILQRILCPQCVIDGERNPHIFHPDLNSFVCEKNMNHTYERSELLGGYRSESRIKSSFRRRKIQSPSDFPNLFVLLPVPVSPGPLSRTFSFSKDGFALHLLCEFQDHWHFLETPGYKISQVSEFVRVFGDRIVKVMRMCSEESSSVEIEKKETRKFGSMTASSDMSSISSIELTKAVFKRYLHDFLTVFPDYSTFLKPSISQTESELINDTKSQTRSELAKFMNICEEDDGFCGLFPHVINGKTVWMCKDHSWPPCSCACRYMIPVL